jgi:hypothetical protein
MRKIYTIDICLDDLNLKTGRQSVELVFDLIAKVKAAVFAQAGQVFDWSYSNTRDPAKNIDGNIGTLSFDIGTQDNWERKLSQTYLQVAKLGRGPGAMYETHLLVSFHRSANAAN